jgi:hypothetical protein
LAFDEIVAGGSPLALGEFGDPPVSIAQLAVHHAPDIGCEFWISGAALGTTLRTFAGRSLNQIGMGHPERLYDLLHQVHSGGDRCSVSSTESYRFVVNRRRRATW